MKIAVVGGIGSGKSEVMKQVADMGIACLSADEINAELLMLPEYVDRLRQLFPSAVNDGVVDKRELAGLVFNDAKAREALNALAHPLIVERIKNDSRSPLVVEVPLILESGAKGLFDKIVFVNAPLDKRIERLVKSRGMTQAEVMARINAQVDDKDYLTVADWTINNDSSVEDLHAKVKELFGGLLK